tara:strand:- start:1409 stop:1660 length:252 start_codon:yes stop_codon:yes gene_type:complete
MEIDKELVCYKAYMEYKVPCQKNSCRYWIKYPCNQNCTLISAYDGPKTLQEIGDIFGVTRMRICQIEKSIKNKLVNIEDYIDV